MALPQVLAPIEREAAGPAQEVDLHGLTERLPSVHDHEGLKTSNSTRWKEWGEEQSRKSHNSFIVNGLRKL